MNENEKEPKKTKQNFPNMSKDELNTLARDIATDKVFCSFFLRESEAKNLLGRIFMPVLFGALNDYSKEVIEDIGFICEYYNKAGPRSINGYPMFMSCKFVSKADAKRIMTKVQKITKMLKDI